MGEVSASAMGDERMDLPPGFRFHPTDEEIITHYLSQKVVNPGFTARALGEVDLNRCEPWHLPSKAKLGEKEWYFFCQRDRKYPTGRRTNRATEAGYWKATGKDKEIYRGRGVLVGMKKTLVFYRGRAPKGEKTNWVMHEYRLEGKLQYYNLTRTAKEEWVVCRVFHKNLNTRRSPVVGLARVNSASDDLDSFAMPALMNPPYLDSDNRPTSSFVNGEEGNVLKGDFASGTAPMASYFSTMLGMENPEEQHKSFLPSNHSNTSNEMNQSMFLPQIPPQNPYSFLPVSGYLHQEQAMMKARAGASDASSGLKGNCKVEQISNSMACSVSQHMTRLSNDRNTENSSAVSKNAVGSCQSYNTSLRGPSSGGPVLDFDNLWKY